MNTIGTCSLCGGAVVSTEGSLPKCSNCGAEAENAHGPTVKMKSANVSSDATSEIRKTLEATVDRWCPKTNPNGGPTASFEQRMANALLAVNSFEIDYRRVMSGGKALREGYPLPLPSKEKEPVTT